VFLGLDGEERPLGFALLPFGDKMRLIMFNNTAFKFICSFLAILIVAFAILIGTGLIHINSLGA
jgi:hypothetical protein